MDTAAVALRTHHYDRGDAFVGLQKGYYNRSGASVGLQNRYDDRSNASIALQSGRDNRSDGSVVLRRKKKKKNEIISSINIKNYDYAISKTNRYDEQIAIEQCGPQEHEYGDIRPYPGRYRCRAASRIAGSRLKGMYRPRRRMRQPHH